MAETDDTDEDRDIVTEADATSPDGKRYKSLIIDKSGETSDDS